MMEHVALASTNLLGRVYRCIIVDGGSARSSHELRAEGGPTQHSGPVVDENPGHPLHRFTQEAIVLLLLHVHNGAYAEVVYSLDETVELT